MNRTSWTLYTGNEISFGRGSRNHLQRILGRQGCRRALIVADENLVTAGIVEKVMQPIGLAGCDAKIYLGEVEPSSQHAEELTELAADFHPEAWIGLGGGSNMDLAKLACAAVSHGKPPTDLFGYDVVPGPIQKLICLPTTAGTGSEVSHAAIIKHAATGRKTPVLSQYVRPHIALVDPELTDSCPPKVAAESGIDALTHAIEAFLAKSHSALDDDFGKGLPYEGSHCFSDMFAERAIELIGANLVAAVNEPNRKEPRDAMALAATLAGIAFSSAGVTLVHALEYFVGDRYPCTHGVGNGILLPSVMEFYLPASPQRLARVAQLLGAPQASPAAAIERVQAIRSACHLPHSLSEVGAEADDLPELAASAAALKRLIQLAPRASSEQDLLQILESCL